MLKLGAAGVIRDAEGRVLLVRESHPEWEPEQEPYVVPGGKIEDGETPRDAAEREIFEETGIVAKVGPLVGVYVSRADDVLLAFVFVAEVTAGVATLPAGDEIIELGWFDPAQLPTPCPSISTAAIADAVEGRCGVYREV
jgi:8-oxo-dGTP diphosphatase